MFNAIINKVKSVVSETAYQARLLANRAQRAVQRAFNAMRKMFRLDVTQDAGYTRVEITVTVGQYELTVGAIKAFKFIVSVQLVKYNVSYFKLFGQSLFNQIIVI